MDKLRNMEVMVAVVEAGSFAAAARQLQISAVMVGKHIQQLEAHLGARLFQRSTRQNSLTEVGAAFYEDSKRVLEQVRWAILETNGRISIVPERLGSVTAGNKKALEN